MGRAYNFSRNSIATTFIAACLIFFAASIVVCTWFGEVWGATYTQHTAPRVPPFTHGHPEGQHVGREQLHLGGSEDTDTTRESRSSSTRILV